MPQTERHPANMSSGSSVALATGAPSEPNEGAPDVNRAVTKPLPIAELFAGIGGVTGGFVDTGGFDPVFLNDIDPAAQCAFASNFPKLANRYRVGRVEDLDGAVLLEAAGGHVGGILGCPPCQGFSAAGARNRHDERNGLLNHFHRLVQEVRPRFFLMENVPSLLGSKLYRLFHNSLEDDYAIHAEVLNAAEYGLPQLRRRAVVFGLRHDTGVVPTLPPPTHGGRGRVFDYCSGRYVRPAAEGRRSLQLRPKVRFPPRELVSLEKAIGDLPSEVAPYEDTTRYARPASTWYQKAMRGGRKLENHRGWRHGAAMRRRLAQVPPGDCPSSHGCRSRNRRFFSQAYARLHPDGLARTITTNFHNPGSGRFTHYAAPRTLTLREALRLQGFSDSFRFDMGELPNYQAERLIGNAFPPPLARVLAVHVRALLN